MPSSTRGRSVPAFFGRVDPYFAVGFGSVLALGVLFTVVSAHTAPPVHPERMPQAVLTRLRTEATGQVMGSRPGAVRVVEITDYQCPACATAHRETWGLLQRYAAAGAITYEVRNVALPGHSNAAPAAVAATCVATVAPGSFWSFHDLLYATQEQWAGRLAPQPTLLGLVARVGGDSARVRACMEARGDALAAGVQQAFHTAAAAGFPYTPVWMVNGKVVLWQDLEQEIRAAGRDSGRAG
ncbi:MAG TPA: thioredoxin domain-containing protein [Longimicrobium sp.]|jgi:protein-disulfide isomerase|nr:thioredoxin domain-containing protein [Longimicrobium sp.]